MRSEHAVPAVHDGLLTSLPAKRLAELVREGDVTAVEVAQAHLDRTTEAEPWIRALVHVDRADVLAQAARIDARLRSGRPGGLLAGVPVAVKDNVDVRGQPTSSGSAALGSIALKDAPVVRRLRRSGAVVFARANMDELALGASTQTSAFGRSHNPHDVRRSAGGSSGGSAAAVAAHEVAVSVGTDTGGSIREPASQCGVAGMAPTLGLVPMDGVVPFAPGLDRVGPLARTVTDLAELLAVLAGNRRLAAIGEPIVRGLRVGVLDELRGPRNQPAILARLDVAAEALSDLGAEMIRVSAPAADRALAMYMTLTSAAAVPVLEAYVESGRAGAEVERRYEVGRELRDELPHALAAARGEQQALHDQVTRALAGCDVLLSPTMPTTAPVLEGHITPEELADPLAAPYTDCWTVVANLVGLPALSVPSGRSDADGMPVGTMVMGPAHSDALLLRVGAALEATGIDET